MKIVCTLKAPSLNYYQKKNTSNVKFRKFFMKPPVSKFK